MVVNSPLKRPYFLGGVHVVLFLVLFASSGAIIQEWVVMVCLGHPFRLCYPLTAWGSTRSLWWVSLRIKSQKRNCFVFACFLSMVWVTWDTYERLAFECVFLFFGGLLLEWCFSFWIINNCWSIGGNLLAKSKLFAKVAYLSSMKNSGRNKLGTTVHSPSHSKTMFDCTVVLNDPATSFEMIVC